MPTPVRVLLADDHTVMREGLSALLERDPAITVVAEAATGRAAVSAALRTRPDVVVMDFSMPDLNGVEACRQIRQQLPECRVIFLSMYADRVYFARAVEAGASGYLVKSTAAAEIREAVLGVARDEIYLAATLAQAVLRAQAPPDPDPAARLTDREREVLLCVANGQTSREIARDLGISVKTVQTHRENIMEKLSLRNISQLVRFAIRCGLISPEEG